MHHFRVLISLLTATLLAPATIRAEAYLWQTNAGGDDIHIFDTVSGALVERLVVGANPHSIVYAPGGGTVFVSLEKNGAPAGELLWIDVESFDVIFRLPVGPEPHTIAVAPDGH